MQKIRSLNSIEFCHLLEAKLYAIQYILQMYSKMSAHFYCRQSSDNLFWTPHDLKECLVWSKSDCKIFYVKWISGPCAQRRGWHSHSRTPVSQFRILFLVTSALMYANYQQNMGQGWKFYDYHNAKINNKHLIIGNSTFPSKSTETFAM